MVTRCRFTAALYEVTPIGHLHPDPDHPSAAMDHHLYVQWNPVRRIAFIDTSDYQRQANPGRHSCASTSTITNGELRTAIAQAGIMAGCDLVATR